MQHNSARSVKTGTKGQKIDLLLPLKKHSTPSFVKDCDNASVIIHVKDYDSTEKLLLH